MNSITIGIPCYQNVPSETLEDYMRFAYYLGRRYTDYEFFLAIKSKTEQFRARNAIVDAGLQLNSKYILMLDDDHVIDWENRQVPTDQYLFLQKLIDHMEADPQLGLVGALYYHRGGECRPVLMKEGKGGGFYWMRDDEIIGGLQDVGVQGGGCMLLNSKALLKITHPIFEPEFDLGTDIQVCKKMREVGYKVACDTSIEIGHVRSAREVITSKNRHRIWADESIKVGKKYQGPKEGMDPMWQQSTAMMLYRSDVMEYTGMDETKLIKLALEYEAKNFVRFHEYQDKRDYYKSLGEEQLARQFWYHHNPDPLSQMENVLGLIDTNRDGYGLEFGCGSAPVSFELALRGHKIDFVDIDGTPAYEFTKWRAKKRNVKCGFELNGPYDYILLMDSIEHLDDWKGDLAKMVALLKPMGAIFTNYFSTYDFSNVEHISMDHESVKNYLTSLGVFPVNRIMWLKQDMNVLKEKPDLESAA